MNGMPQGSKARVHHGHRVLTERHIRQSERAVRTGISGLGEGGVRGRERNMCARQWPMLRIVYNTAELRKNGSVAQCAWNETNESERLRKRSNEAVHGSSNGNAAGMPMAQQRGLPGQEQVPQSPCRNRPIN